MANEYNAKRGAKPLIQILDSSPAITAKMASEIRTLRKKGMFQHHVAALFGINQGRVSEIVNGKRFANVEPASDDQLEFRFE